VPVQRREVIVLGAGLTGLSAGLELAGAGKEVLVLEEGPRVGGLAASFEHRGFHLDLGPHRYHSQSLPLLEQAADLLGEDLLRCHMQTSLSYAGHEYLYPLSLRDVLSKVDKVEAARMVADFLRTRLRPGSPPRSFADWVVSRYGRRLYDSFFCGYTAKVWGVDPSLLDASWAEQRIASKGLVDTIAKMLAPWWVRRHGQSIHSPYEPEFLYSARGMGLLAERLAERMQARGGELELGSRVSALRPRRGGILVRCGQRDYLARRVISTLPLTTLAALLGFRHMPALRYRGILFLYALADTTAVLKKHWIYYQDREVLFNRVTDFHHFTPALAPRGRSALCFELTADPGEPAWDMSAEQLAARVLPQFERIRPGFSATVDEVLLRKVGHGYPVLHLGYREELERTMRRFSEVEGLHLAGRNGTFSYINMDHCLEQGRVLARRLAASG